MSSEGTGAGAGTAPGTVEVELPLGRSATEPAKPTPPKRVFSPFERVSEAQEILGVTLAVPPTNVDEFQRMLQSYQPSIDSTLDGLVKALRSLRLTTDDFFTRVLPDIITRAVAFPTLFSDGVPLMPPGASASVSLTREQVHCLNCNMFLCTFSMASSFAREHRFVTGMNYASFDYLLQGIGAKFPEAEAQKLAAFLNYFSRIATPAPDLDDGKVVVYRRMVLDTAPDWASSDNLLLPMEFEDAGGIEDASDCIQVDFANKFFGGGVLTQGCVQEEILIAISPELLPALLFLPKLERTEAFAVTGAERFSSYKGYAKGFRFGGDYRDDSDFSKKAVIGMDAFPFNTDDGPVPVQIQLRDKFFMRELAKSYAAFSVDGPECPVADAKPIATGNWGCGVFGGDVQVKCMIQWMSASQTLRSLRYFPFRNRVVQGPFAAFTRSCVEKGVSVGALFTALLSLRDDRRANYEGARLLRTLRTVLDLPPPPAASS